MMRTTIFPGRYVQGEGVTERMGSEMQRLGEKALVLADPFIYDEQLDRFRDALQDGVDSQVERFGGECCDSEIEKHAATAKEAGVELIAGLGGGKTLDTAKAVAHKCSLPVAVIPTLASTDAPCSALAVIYTEEGGFDRYLFLPSNPELVMLDLQVVADAPARFLVSGMGDALATWFEARVCRDGYKGNMTGDVGSLAAYTMAQLCYETLLEDGLGALQACEAGVVTHALDHVVEANTLLSGLGFESGGLAAAHAIHNGLTAIESTHEKFHGEKVSLGTLAQLMLTDERRELIDEVYDFCESVGLPICFEQAGLGEATDEELLAAAQGACAEGETIHNLPFDVTPPIVVAALKAADAEGWRRRGTA